VIDVSDAARQKADLVRIEKARNSIEAFTRVLEELVRSSSSEVRMRALEGLADWDRSRLIGETQKAIHDRNELVRVTAMEIAARHRLTELQAEVCRAFTNDKSWLARAAAAIALGDMEVLEAKDALEASIDEANEEERVRIYYALTKLGNDEYLSPFLEGLFHEHYRVRCATANLLPTLVNGPSKKLAQILVSCALDRETTVAAKSSLEETLRVLTESNSSAPT